MSELEILELAHWGASCLQDEYYAILHETLGQATGKQPKRKISEAKRKEAQAGFDKCQEQMDWLMFQIIKLERKERSRT